MALSCANAVSTPFAKMPPEIAADADSYTQELMTECPPSHCVLMSVGLTNAILDSFLRVKMRAQGIEGSYLRYLPFYGLVEIETWPAEKKRLFFEKVLPTPQELEGKRLIFYRVLIGGKTIKTLIAEILSYYQSLGYHLNVGAYLIADGTGPAQFAHFTLQSHGGEFFFRAKDNRSFFKQFAYRSVIWTRYGTAFKNSIENFHRYHGVPVTNTATFIDNEQHLELDREVRAYLSGLPSSDCSERLSFNRLGGF